MAEPGPLRVAVLTGAFSASYDAQLAALRERTGATVEIAYEQASPSAPFADEEFGSLAGALAWKDDIPSGRVHEMLDRLQPHVLAVTSWNHGAYMKLARAWRHRALRVMLMDNPWLGTRKQWAGVAVAPAYIRPAVDVVFLPNERQRVFARKLGFSDDQIWLGVYGCDQPRFEVDRVATPNRARSFLFVGRLVPAKGVDLLLEAHAAYRRRVEDPWPLDVVGTGPLGSQVAEADGVTATGFVQPSAVPDLFARAGCFVLPSTFEPWGTVIHEATAAGLPVICTTACGAWLDLVRDGYNGFVVPPGNARALADALVRVATMDQGRRGAMAEASVGLSRQLTPQLWADSFDERARAWLARAEEAGAMRRTPG